MPVPVWRNRVPMALLAHEKKASHLSSKPARLPGRQPATLKLSEPIYHRALQVAMPQPQQRNLLRHTDHQAANLYFDSGHLT